MGCGGVVAVVLVCGVAASQPAKNNALPTRMRRRPPARPDDDGQRIDVAKLVKAR